MRGGLARVPGAHIMVWPGASWVSIRAPVAPLLPASAADSAFGHFQVHCPSTWVQDYTRRVRGMAGAVVCVCTIDVFGLLVGCRPWQQYFEQNEEPSEVCCAVVYPNFL